MQFFEIKAANELWNICCLSILTLYNRNV